MMEKTQLVGFLLLVIGLGDMAMAAIAPEFFFGRKAGEVGLKRIRMIRLSMAIAGGLFLFLGICLLCGFLD